MSAYGRLSVTESNFTNLESGKTYDVTVDDSGHVEVVAEAPTPVGETSGITPQTTDEIAAPITGDAVPSEIVNPKSVPAATA